uniref:aldehyde dehydrogenase family 3 member A2-like n=1 Tax=Myxine glutinosa TaxID=7769 RepID=UPI00358EE16B
MQAVVHKAREAFKSGRTLPLEFRKEQLCLLTRLLDENEEAICEALANDLRKSYTEAICFELIPLRNEVQGALQNLHNWAAAQSVSGSLLTIGTSIFTMAQPLGVCAIIGAWNYPLALTLTPLVGAIAAGNAAVLKPPEAAEYTAKLLQNLVPRYLDKELYPVLLGGADVAVELLHQRFDHIFYTGGSVVGRSIMTAAAKHLTPVTLELGGKSPCYIHNDCDLRIACRRIAWGRFINAGQTCIAPDYVVCEPALCERVVEELRAALQEYYGEDPQKSPDYGRIINSRHFKRVRGLLEGGGTVAIGGQTDEEDLYIAPTVMTNVDPEASVMQEEVFGPILPVLTLPDVEQTLNFINDREKPLVIYVFSKDQKIIKRFVNETSSGGMMANDVILHYSIDTLPFGGVGNSGTGAYHGKFSFDAFSHRRACLLMNLALEGVNSVRYPPYSSKKLSWMIWLVKKRRQPPIKLLLSIFMMGVLCAILLKYAILS